MYVALIAVPEKGPLKPVAFFSGARTDVFIWDALIKQYISPKPATTLQEHKNNFRNLWTLVQNNKLKRFELVTLLTTYNNIILEFDHIPEIADAFKQFNQVYNPDNQLVHLLSQYYILRSLGLMVEPTTIPINTRWVFEKPKEEIVGVCWALPSDPSNVWHIKERIYDISIHNSHGFMFNEYKDEIKKARRV